MCQIASQLPCADFIDECNFCSMFLCHIPESATYNAGWNHWLKEQLLQLFLKSSPTTCSIAYEMAQGWERWGRQHCTDKSITWARCWAAAGAGKDGKQQPAQGLWSSWKHLLVDLWGGISSYSVNLKAPWLRNLPQKMGITTSCTRLMGSDVQAMGQEKMDALLGCRVWKNNLVLCDNLAFKKRLSFVGSFCRECKLHTNTHPYMPWRASSNTQNTPKTSSYCLSLIA